MSGLLQRLFDVDSLSPHGICLTWRPELLWLHAVSDAVIGTAYFSIPVALALFVTRRRDLTFGWMLWLFVGFILACGSTHFLSIVTLWVPIYASEGIVKAVTAALSISTAVLLWPLIPKMLAIPSPSQLRHEAEQRRHAEIQLAQAQKMEAIGQLTAGIAHDFNNLLTAVLLNLDRIERAKSLDAVQRQVSTAIAATEKAADLSTKMLAFARTTQTGAAELDPNDIIRKFAPILSTATGGAALAHYELHATRNVAVEESLLQSAILNLVVNARDAVEGVAAGFIAVRTDDVPDGVAITVADNGAGMSPAVRDRAFEPFFTTKEVGSGSGLGLAQVYGFVRAARGDAAIVSAPGQGTTVTITLPITARVQ